MTEQPGEARLVARAAAGRLDAFEELVRRYQLPVYRVALRMLGDRADAEDAAQDAFLQAWQALPGFAGRSRFSTWLYRIVTNRARLDVNANTDLTQLRRNISAVLERLAATTGIPPRSADITLRLVERQQARVS